jgi:hypothetical protein
VTSEARAITRPETVLRAARLIKTGEVFELGAGVVESMPLPPPAG